MSATKSTVPAVTSTPTSTGTSASTAVPSTLQPLTTASSLSHAPTVPTGYTPLTKEELSRLTKLAKSQRTNLAPLASEIGASTTYAQDFGAYAPTQADVVDLLTGAAATSSEVTNAKAWAKYASDLDAVTIDAAYGATQTLGRGLDYALASNPTLAARYPLLAAFVKTKSAAISKAYATKKSAKAKAAKTAAETAAPTPAPAAAAK